MRKFALILASAAFAASTAGIGAALAQTAAAPAQPDATSTEAAPAKPATTAKTKHQKMAMNKKAKAKKAVQKHPATQPTGGDGTSTE